MRDLDKDELGSVYGAGGWRRWCPPKKSRGYKGGKGGGKGGRGGSSSGGGGKGKKYGKGGSSS